MEFYEDDNNRDFAPDWISVELKLKFEDFSKSLDAIDGSIDVKKDGWIYNKCNNDFEILRNIIEKKPLRITIPR
jgi:hypothetical protein